jgi:pilus assembly protein CpaF
MFQRFAKQLPEVVPPNDTVPSFRREAAATPFPVARPAASPSALNQRIDFVELKVRLHQRLIDILNLAAIDKVAHDDLSREVGAIVRELLVEEGIALNAREYTRLVEEILDEVLGLGPIEPLLKDPTVADILVNTYSQVFVERNGQLELTGVKFKDNRHLYRIIDKIVAAVGRRVDEAQPWVDARLPDGSRVNAMVPPCAVDGPLLSIRKFSRMPFTIERLIEVKTISAEMAQFLEGIVRARLNVLISGGTGSGKTTLLNALSGFIPGRERIITIEDTAELQLQQAHVARMETRPPNIEAKGEVSQRDLVRNALRMRPDRIVVGEVRGAEVLDMLQAMNTGHEGSMTTVHANSARDALTRLEHMVGMTGIEITGKSLRQQMASALHLVIQLQRMGDGRRRVVSIQEITGMEGDVIAMQEIFVFDRTSTDSDGTIHGNFKATGIRPRFIKRLEQWGIPLPQDLFSPSRVLG